MSRLQRFRDSFAFFMILTFFGMIFGYLLHGFYDGAIILSDLLKDSGTNWTMVGALATLLATIVALLLGLFPHLKLWIVPKPNLVFSDLTMTKETENKRKKDVISLNIENKKRYFWKTGHAQDITGQIIFNDCNHDINFANEVYISKYLLVGKKNT